MQSKPRLVEVTDDELTAIRAGGLGAPHTYSNRERDITHFWCNADELRKWRAFQAISGVQHE